MITSSAATPSMPARRSRRQAMPPPLAPMAGAAPAAATRGPPPARSRRPTRPATLPPGEPPPQGAVIKSTAIDPSVVDPDGVYRKVGPARVFTRERDAILAIKSRGQGALKAGDVMVLICRGPMGAGMEEIYQITAALRHLSWGKH